MEKTSNTDPQKYAPSSSSQPTAEVEETVPGATVKEPTAEPLRWFFDGMYSIALEDVTGLGDLAVPKKSSSSEVGGPNSSPRLINRFSAPSTDPGWKRSIIISITDDAQVLSAPVRIDSYLWCLVTEVD